MVLAGTVMGMPGLDGGLAGRDLTLAGLEDLAHEHVVDLVGGHAGPLQRLGDGKAAQVHGGEAGQRARQLPDGGPSPCDDDGLSHSLHLRVCSPVWLPAGNHIVRANYRRVT